MIVDCIRIGVGFEEQEGVEPDETRKVIEVDHGGRVERGVVALTAKRCLPAVGGHPGDAGHQERPLLGSRHGRTDAPPEVNHPSASAARQTDRAQPASSTGASMMERNCGWPLASMQR